MIQNQLDQLAMSKQCFACKVKDSRKFVTTSPTKFGLHKDCDPNDYFTEWVAHSLAYKKETSSEYSYFLSQHRDFILAWGYDPDTIKHIDDSETGLQVLRLDPLTSWNCCSRVFCNDCKKFVLAFGSIVCFRGTEPDSVNDISSDLAHEIGSTQYEPNALEINKFISEAQGQVIVTGHSLGGALAQHAAAAPENQILGKIRHVVGFQAPGISREEADAFNESNSCIKVVNRQAHTDNEEIDDIKQVPMTPRTPKNPKNFVSVRFHSVRTDIVTFAGEERLDATYFEYIPKQWDDCGPVTSHTSHLLYSARGIERLETTIQKSEKDNVSCLTRHVCEGIRALFGGGCNQIAAPCQGMMYAVDGMKHNIGHVGSGVHSSASQAITGVIEGFYTNGSDGVIAGVENVVQGLQQSVETMGSTAKEAGTESILSVAGGIETFASEYEEGLSESFNGAKNLGYAAQLVIQSLLRWV